MAIQGFFTGDVKIRDLNGVLKAVDGIVEVATDAGTVTSVGLTVGSTGTDVNVANSPVTTSGSITLNIPTSSATNRGLLSSADWSTFNSKQGSLTLTTTGNNGSATLVSGTLNIPTYTLAGLGGISLTSLSASSPLAYNNTTGEFSIQVANGSQSGYLSSSDWTAFNSKQAALTFSAPLVNTAGTISIPAATSSVNGYLTSTDWSTFNNKQATITLTTTGSSGAATLIGATLNIPNYTGGLSGYVPYTGATTNVDLGEYELKAGQLTLDVSPTGTAAVGTTRWNNTIGSSETTLKGGNVLLKNGVDLVARVVNKVTPNTTLTKAGYAAVRVSGAQGQRLAVAYAQANNDNNSADTIGLVTETIATNQEGFIMTVGQLLDINTTGSLQGETWADGDVLYLSPTTPGALTNVKPNGSTGHIVVMGYVEYAHANHGSIYVKIMNGWELDELHNVYISSVANNQGLFYESSTQLWKNKSIATVLGYTPANAATTITINGTTYDISTNRTWSVGTVTSIGTSGPITGGTITGSGTIGITQATTSTDGYLSSTDWNTFYNKQAAGSYITALTGEATASGPGSATVTLSTSAVTGKLLTGLNLTGGGSIAATDSILQAFGKVQNQISGLAGGVTYQGTWNASTNTPTLTSSVGTKGYYYIVDVAGSTNLNGITDWKVGDWAIFNGSTWDKVDNTDAVSSVNGFTGAVSLTTSNIAEGTNLYYLDSRARLALSFTAGSGAYDNTTGVITIPTNTSQLTNGANFITLSSLSASSPLAYNSGTGAFSIQVATGSQNGYLSSTDWTTFNGKQNALTLTTTGSSGSATLVGATLNVPTYTLSGLGGVPTSRQLTINGTAYDLSADRSWSVGTHTGSLTSGYIPKATGSTTLTDGLLYDTGSAVLLGTQTAGSGKFMVYSSTADNHYQAIGTAPSFRFADTITSPTYTGIVGLATASNHFIIGAVAGDMVLSNNTSSAGNFLFGTGATERMRINATTGNVSIGNTGNTFKLEVTGTTKISGQLTLGSTITNGTYTYTLPSATGTIALTSDISGMITGSGTTNYLPKFTGTSTIGDSIVQDASTYIDVAGYAFLRRGGKYLLLNPNYAGATVYADISAEAGMGLSLSANGVTKQLYIDTSGNLGLGVTPSAWNSGYKVMDVSAWGSIAGEFGTQGTISLVSNCFANSTGYNNWTYVNTAPATRYKQYNGEHQWYNAPSGTAGNAISFTQAMTLNASGNLGLGTSSPTSYASRFIEISNSTSAGIKLTGGTSGNSLGSAIEYVASDKTLRLTTYEAGSSIRFNPVDSEAMRLNASGNLSIGNTNDTYKLDVTGTGRFTGVLNVFSTGSTQLFLKSTGGGSNRDWQFQTNETAAGDISLLQSTTAGGSTYSRIFNLSPTGAATFSSSVTIQGGNSLTLLQSGNANGSLIKSVSNGDFRVTTGGTTDALTITNGGNVGIGTTSPDYKLQVSSATKGIGVNEGNIVIASNESLAANIGGSLGFGATSDYGLLTIAKVGGYRENATGTSASSYLAFETRSGGNAVTERMRITSGGDIGIGNTGDASVRLFVSGKDTSSNNYAALFRNSSGSNLLGVKNSGTVNMGSLPTSSTGLSSGDIWKDGTTLRIV